MENNRACPDPFNPKTLSNSQRALVSFGANLPSHLGSAEDTLKAGLTLLEQSGFRPIACSALYRTPAFPAGSGPEFVNGACSFETSVSPKEILYSLQRIEAELGRERRERWGPRACDFDLLAVGDMVLPDAGTARHWAALGPDLASRTDAPDELVLPHPRMTERSFVLVPLMDVAPDWRHPLTGRTVREHHADLSEPDRDSVVRIAA
ncbi:MAG: 2-amino-4-hydroxy-6-hydroxymethyldihydropteridine diphosphokinase [Pseudomonadota bacterium]